MHQSSSILLAGILALVVPLGAKAATITTGGSSIGITSINSGGPTSLEYDFFGTTTDTGTSVTGGPDLSTLTYATYTPVAPTTTSFTYPTFSQLKIDGTTYQTGVYLSGQIITSETTLGTITFNSSVPSNITLGIFTDNFDNSLNDTSYSVSVSGDATAALIPSSGNTSSNDIFYLSLTGVTASDVITIKGTSGFEPLIGGITLQTSSVPEPSTYALLGLGFLALALKLRGRSAKIG